MVYGYRIWDKTLNSYLLRSDASGLGLRAFARGSHRMDSPLKLLDQSLHIHSISHMLLLKPVAANAREAIAIRHSKASAGVELAMTANKT